MPYAARLPDCRVNELGLKTVPESISSWGRGVIGKEDSVHKNAVSYEETRPILLMCEVFSGRGSSRVPQLPIHGSCLRHVLSSSTAWR